MDIVDKSRCKKYVTKQGAHALVYVALSRCRTEGTSYLEPAIYLFNGKRTRKIKEFDSLEWAEEYLAGMTANSDFSDEEFDKLYDLYKSQ